MKKTIIIFCLLSGYLVLFFNLGTMPFYGADEPRYARIGQEMLESRDFITPTLDHRPWLEKPPLLYWMESASFALLGEGEGSARFPNALLCLLAALATGYLGWRVSGKAWSGVYAYMILLSSLLFVLFGRAASTDMVLTVTYTFMLIAAFIAIEENSVFWASMAGLSGALAVLSKGPVGVVLAGGTLFVYLLVLRRFPSGKVFAAFTAVMTAVALPWFVLVWIANGNNFFLTFIVNHHIARFVTDLHHHSQPFWYYIPVLLIGFFPWVFFLFPSFREFLTGKRDLSEPVYRLRLFLWLWAAVPLAFFSFSSAKLPGYILPSLPALALLASLEWTRCQEGKARLLPGRFFQFSLVCTSLVLGIGLPVASYMEYGRIDVGLSAGIPILAGNLAGIWWGRKGLVNNSFFAISGGMVLAMAALFAVGSPVLGRYHSTAELVGSVSSEISEREPLVQYRFFHHTAIYYAYGQITPGAIGNPQGLIEYIDSHPQEAYLLLTTSHGLEEFQTLPGTEVHGPVGKLYILKLANLDKLLAERIRSSLVEKHPES